MTYDFDTVVDRRNTGSIKWNCAPNELPMWVADMDFKTAPEIIEAFRKRIDHGVFGYSDYTKEWFDAYINWWDRRHGIKYEEEDLIFCTGVIPALSSIVRKLTTPNENVVIMTPVYNVFFNSILNNGCRALEVPLIYENSSYSVDFENLEIALKNPQTSLMILCNPHNPAGKIWDKETLARIGKLAFDNGVIVVSDEIHCDLTMPGSMYVPFASVSEECRMNSISLMAPTKTFNLAGLQTSCVAVPNKRIHHKVWRALNTDEVAEPNSFALVAAITAFTQGENWLDELRSYISANRDYVIDRLQKEAPEIKVVSEDATYLLWIDIKNVSNDSEKFAADLRSKTGLWITEGVHYGAAGEGFIRMNIACPRTTLVDGVNRLITGVKSL
ncbi:MAG: pyridoxal phosphate-dependent aminotransferase [Clostridia bacterium]|nr:pyridoxal phosphate-dependent aminotransferase [Clostridia bacterium]